MLFGNDKIEVYQTVEDGIVKLGARVNDPEANVADLLEAWQLYATMSPFTKSMAITIIQPVRDVPITAVTQHVIPDLISFGTWLPNCR